MNIIVTGASRGIGFQVVKGFLEDAQHKVLALSRNIENLTKLKQEANNAENLAICQFDITDYKEADLLTATEHFDQIDILINNAGSLVNKPFIETSIEEWKQVFEVNLFAPVKMIKDLIPKMKLASRAHIVNIGSMGGFQGSMKFKGLSAYSSSKSALVNLTECLAEELKEDNIAVNCLCLGAVNTQMLRTAFPDFNAPLDSNEMAEFICEFALHHHKYLNGKILPISLSTP